MLTNLDLIAIIIALGGSVTVMCLFWKQNIQLTKQNRFLRNRIKELQK
jgi:hypothetical protein